MSFCYKQSKIPLKKNLRSIWSHVMAQVMSLMTIHGLYNKF